MSPSYAPGTYNSHLLHLIYYYLTYRNLTTLPYRFGGRRGGESDVSNNSELTKYIHFSFIASYKTRFPQHNNKITVGDDELIPSPVGEELVDTPRDDSADAVGANSDAGSTAIGGDGKADTYTVEDAEDEILASGWVSHSPRIVQREQGECLGSDQLARAVARAQAAGRIDKKMVKGAAKMRDVVLRSVRGPPPRNEALIRAAGPNVSDV